MTAALRGLLQEAYDELSALYQAFCTDSKAGMLVIRCGKLLPRIYSALAESAPEPLRIGIIRSSSRGKYLDPILANIETVPDGTNVYAVPPPASPDDARDAARYRWLRDTKGGIEFRDGSGAWRADCPRAEELDAILDAALERGGRGKVSRWERRLWCWLMGHRLIVWQEFSNYARRVKCEHCDGDWAMNDKERAFLPWHTDFEKLYEMLGHRIRKP